MPPKTAPKRKAANGYKMPEKLAEGTILTTISKKQFRIGKSIGVGGFGEIYLCSENTAKPVGDEAPFALKIEPHENGPLFVEMNFYIRAAAPEAIADFKKSRGLTSLGMPCHRGSGSTMVNGEKYRFLVMDRFGSDLQKIFQTGKNRFSDKITYNLALKIIDSLEYIHTQGYVHNDIKAQNLLLGHGKANENEVYLVDFGLATKYQRPGGHLEFKPDPKKAHDGTIEYTSRDAHIGTHSRRSDLEILGYNLVHWMSGTLPWMGKLTSPEPVHTQKKAFMADIKGSLEQCFGGKNYPDVLHNFLVYVNSLGFEDQPDYDKCRGMFKEALKKAKHPLDGKIDFAASTQKEVKSPMKKVVTTPKAKSPAVKRKAIAVVAKSPAKRANKSSPIKNGTAKNGVTDSGTQTSPAFVKSARAAARAKKTVCEVVNEENEEFVAKAVAAAKKLAPSGSSPAVSRTKTTAPKASPVAKRTNSRSSKVESVQADSPATASALSNPTPAMAALLAKRAAEAAEKGAKKRKKTAVANGGSPTKSRPKRRSSMDSE